MSYASPLHRYAPEWRTNMNQPDIRQSVIRKNEPYINCFSEFLYEVRCTQFRETQETFGDRCHLSQKTISRLENTGRFQMISLNSVVNISDGIGVFPSQFLSQVERELSRKNPDYVENFNQCLDRYDTFFNQFEHRPVDELLQLLQASLMFIRLFQTKEIEQITEEDITPFYCFLQK